MLFTKSKNIVLAILALNSLKLNRRLLFLRLETTQQDGSLVADYRENGSYCFIIAVRVAIFNAKIHGASKLEHESIKIQDRNMLDS